MMRQAAAAALLLSVLLPAPARPADPGSLDAIEKDLAAILSEMDAIRSELDRISEISAAPKATGVRLEIHGSGGAPAPAGFRLLVGGRLEEEREFGKAERNAFAGGSAPIVVEVPLLPGSYQARIELSHPYWKGRPAADFTVGVKTGATALLRFRLSAATGGGPPALTPIRGE
ncbi:MAG: hypothetical protein ACM3NF_06750 [Gemmatimonadota bacterium]